MNLPPEPAIRSEINVEYEFNAGVLNISADGDFMRAEENRTSKSLFVRFIGIVFAAAFLAVALLFWTMEVENAQSVLWIRIILCGGLALIGLLLLWGSFGEKTKFDFVEVDREAGLLISGRDTPTGREVTNRMSLNDIKTVQVGSGQERSQSRSGTTALYVIGEGAPRKGILLVGGFLELEEVQRHILRLTK